MSVYELMYLSELNHQLFEHLTVLHFTEQKTFVFLLVWKPFQMHSYEYLYDCVILFVDKVVKSLTTILWGNR